MSDSQIEYVQQLIDDAYEQGRKENLDVEALERARRVGYSECLLDIQAFIEESGADYMQAIEEVKKDFRKKFND